MEAQPSSNTWVMHIAFVVISANPNPNCITQCKILIPLIFDVLEKQFEG